MTTRSFPAIICILVLALGACLFAGPAQTGKSHSEGRRFIGTVVATDPGASTLVVRSWRGETVFDVSGARISGQEGLEGLEPGERVLIRYLEDSGKKMATAVMEASRKQKAESRPDHAVPEQK